MSELIAIAKNPPQAISMVLAAKYAIVLGTGLPGFELISMMEIDNDASLFGSHFGRHHLSVLCDWVRWDLSVIR